MWDLPRPWLLPWIALLALVAAIPLLVWPPRDRRAWFSPVAYAAWFHILPSFVAGALVLAAGFTPSFFPRIPVPDETVPWAMGLVAAGFLALYAGYAAPVALRAGQALSAWLPNPHWPDRALAPVALAALATAAIINAAAFRLGLIGFQASTAASSFAAAGTMLAGVSAATATLLLMQVVLRREAGRWRMAAAAALAAWVLIDTLASGRRGALVQFVVLGIGTWILAGGRSARVTPRRLVTIGSLGAAAIVVGMMYGTTLRAVLGSDEAARTPEQYATAAVEAVRIVADRGVTGNLAFAMGRFAERLEIVSSVALIVGNADRLAPFEAAYGLTDNIRSSAVSALVPRVVWPDKPTVSDPRAVGELYFGYRNSYAITPVADLVRNFGPWGVPVGMALLGALLRVLYAALIEGRQPSAGRITTYIVLMTAVSYEGFYGSILPVLLRTALILAVLLTGVHVAVRLVQRAWPASART
ncbi:MAG: hypothetical protein R2712_27360 [Vicinamibacterales bacterium]